MKGGELVSPLPEREGEGRKGPLRRSPAFHDKLPTLLRVSVPSSVDGTEVKGRRIRPFLLVVSREGTGKEQRIAG